jgi:hypothetical protein
VKSVAFQRARAILTKHARAFEVMSFPTEAACLDEELAMNFRSTYVVRRYRSNFSRNLRERRWVRRPRKPNRQTLSATMTIAAAKTTLTRRTEGRHRHGCKPA